MQATSVAEEIAIVTIPVDYLPLVHFDFELIYSGIDERKIQPFVIAVESQDSKRGNLRLLTSVLQHRRTQVLFLAEYHCFIEYHEWMIPFVYAAYTSVLFFLPNAEYYRDMKHVHHSDELRSALIRFCVVDGMQLVSSIVLHTLLLRYGAFRWCTCWHSHSSLSSRWIPLCLLMTLKHTRDSSSRFFHHFCFQPFDNLISEVKRPSKLISMHRKADIHRK